MKFTTKLLLLCCLGLGIFFSSNSAVGYYENRTYCEVAKESVRIYLSDHWSLLHCANYLETIELALIQEFDTFQQLEKMVKRGEDILYRMDLRDQKLVTIKQLFAQRMMILKAVQDFEALLLEKFQAMVYDYLQLKDAFISGKIQELSQKDNASFLYQSELAQLKNQKNLIETLQTTSVMDEFVQALSKYLVLEKERKWK